MLSGDLDALSQNADTRGQYIVKTRTRNVTLPYLVEAEKVLLSTSGQHEPFTCRAGGRASAACSVAIWAFSLVTGASG